MLARIRSSSVLTDVAEEPPPSMFEDKVTVAHDAEKEEPAVEVTFDAMALLPELKATVAKLGYVTPSPIQAEMIPHVLDGKDVLGQAQTGTGKTAAFALPILSRIDLQSRCPQVVVLAPTRELAIQVATSFKQYGAGLKGFSVATIYGGQDYEVQLRQLRKGVQVVVGTPGRTIDHIKRRTLDTSGINCVVLDEADEMLNMGFVEDVEFVLEQTSENRQVCLFSATMPRGIRSIAKRYLKDPVEIRIKNKTQTVTSIRQRCLMVLAREKPDALIRILETEETDGVIVFAKTRGSTVEIAEGLARRGYSSAALNGDVPQRQRERTVEALKSGRIDIVVATDVAARGLDVQRISHVFNYDMPPDSEVYVHRIGRTGRAGRSGEAILFVTRSERGKLGQIEKRTRQPIERMDLPTIDAVNERRILKFKQKIVQKIEAADELEFFTELLASFQKEHNHSPEVVAAALANLAQGSDPLLLKELPKSKQARPGKRARDRDRGSDRNDRSSRPPRRGFTPPEEGMERFRLELGHKHRVGPGNLVGVITNEAKINGSNIGRIFIYDSHSTVDIRSDVSKDVVKKLKGLSIAGTQLDLVRDTGEGNPAPVKRRGEKTQLSAKPRPPRDAKKRTFSKPPAGEKSKPNKNTAPKGSPVKADTQKTSRSKPKPQSNSRKTPKKKNAKKGALATFNPPPGKKGKPAKRKPTQAAKPKAGKVKKAQKKRKRGSAVSRPAW